MMFLELQLYNDDEKIMININRINSIYQTNGAAYIYVGDVTYKVKESYEHIKKELTNIPEFNMAIKTLEQEPKTDYKAFAELVAEEIFDENWEFNKDAFAELACRKLAKLGIVRAKGDEWELDWLNRRRNRQ